jgi:type III restriction enzyme
VTAQFVTPTRAGIAKVEDSLRQAVTDDTEELRALIAEAVPSESARLVVRRLVKRLAKPIDNKKASARVSVPVVSERLEHGVSGTLGAHQAPHRVPRKRR